MSGPDPVSIFVGPRDTLRAANLDRRMRALERRAGLDRQGDITHETADVAVTAGSVGAAPTLALTSVYVPPEAFVVLTAEVTMYIDGGGLGTVNLFVHVTEHTDPTDPYYAGQQFFSNSSATISNAPRWSTPASTAGLTAAPAIGRVYRPTPGTRTYSLRPWRSGTGSVAALLDYRFLVETV